jgi:hypothetical protein
MVPDRVFYGPCVFLFQASDGEKCGENPRRIEMKTRVWLVSLAAMLVLVATAVAADDPNMGTWKLNEGKSKITGQAKNTKVVYEAAGDSVKVTVDGVDAEGKTIHNEWTGKYDGKDYAVTGDAGGTTRSLKKVNARTLTLANKKDGKVTLSGKIVVSADGKARTVTITGTGADGKKVTNSYVYDKE